MSSVNGYQLRSWFDVISDRFDWIIWDYRTHQNIRSCSVDVSRDLCVNETAVFRLICAVISIASYHFIGLIDFMSSIYIEIDQLNN